MDNEKQRPEAQEVSGQQQRYPAGTVRALLATELVTEPTRRALLERLAAQPGPAPRYFSAAEYATLQAVCARLIVQSGREQPVDLAAAVDERLAARCGDGWRYDALPDDGTAYRRGLRILDSSAGQRSGAAFATLGSAAQDELLRAMQQGALGGDQFAGARFFEDLLAEVCELYYSDPISQEEIGYAGMADAHGWQHIGLNELEAWEPRPLVDGDKRQPD